MCALESHRDNTGQESKKFLFLCGQEEMKFHDMFVREAWFKLYYVLLCGILCANADVLK